MERLGTQEPLGAREHLGVPEPLGSRKSLGPMNLWRPGNPMPVTLVPDKTRGLNKPSFLKHNSQLKAIWALLLFRGCDRHTAGSRLYTTFLGPSGVRDLAFPSPHSMRVIWFPEALWGPVILLPLLPSLQAPGRFLGCTVVLLFPYHVTSSGVCIILILLIDEIQPFRN
jgi:hypothetical protein